MWLNFWTSLHPTRPSTPCFLFHPNPLCYTVGSSTDQWFHREGANGAIRRWAHHPRGDLTHYSQWPGAPFPSLCPPLPHPPCLPPLIPFSSSSSSFLSSVSWCWEQSSIFRPRLLRSSHLAPVASMLSPWPLDIQTHTHARTHAYTHTHISPSPTPIRNKGPQRSKYTSYKIPMTSPGCSEKCYRLWDALELKSDIMLLFCTQCAGIHWAPFSF